MKTKTKKEDSFAEFDVLMAKATKKARAHYTYLKVLVGAVLDDKEALDKSDDARATVREALRRVKALKAAPKTTPASAVEGREIVVFDLETTGIDVKKARIVQIAAIKLGPDLKEISQFHKLINPGVSIPKGASDVHGILDSAVQNKPEFPKLASKIVEFIGDADIAGHNVWRYDLALLNAELERHGRKPINSKGRKIYDTLAISRKHNSGRHNLAVTFARYCGAEMEGAHDARADTRATVKVLLAQLEKHGPDIHKALRR